MNVLTQSIQDKYEDNAVLVGLLAGRFWLTEAPEDNTTYPYITYHIISNVELMAFDQTKDIEQFRIQFSLFSDDSSSVEVGNLFEAVKNCFDRGELPFVDSDYRHVGSIREGATLTIIDEIWQYTVDYMFFMQHA